ncbi:TIGR02281 family clan AA aspartic protease [Sphingomonas spermidinifaciens]|uniref:TIGR02281 family clan AA aspartic protease n=1 Tax=Sphingomonas spermidinifaciens TaxID=1141889 RepID=A0A2A4B505_9SPHN|nr:TIGR02281 family clan AA aspartic protease [Sphingomonas spermidinifaciens]PCD03035.1 TIGR02281 family clan AA aspartic protease [Sphingomonas spermidinifaciens]
MNGDQSVELLWGVGALVLVLSGLTARRVSARVIVRNLLGWAAIAGVLFVLFANQDRLALLAERAGLTGQQVSGDTVRIRQSADGHFYADVRINGVRQRMLVDSGATITALSEDAAQAAGVTAESGFPVVLATANGQVQARRGVAATFAIGELETRDLSVVISPSFGDMSVVGMNFLSRLGSWRVEGRTLILEPIRN